MRLTLVISSLAAGGAERVMSTLANYWAEHDEDVTLVTVWDTSSDFYRLHPTVRRLALGLPKSSTSLWETLRGGLRRARALRRSVLASRPDAVISFIDTTNMLTLLATRGLSLPVLISERVDPRLYDIGILRSWVRRRVYSWADFVVVQSKETAEWMKAIVAPVAIRVIPNPAPASARASLGGERGVQTVVSMGRLVPQKQFDYLLRAFAHCSIGHSEWLLRIIGEGPERSNLEKLAADLGISDRVALPGIISDPDTVLRQADLFVLSSAFEGFPNALLEAMACGLPVVSFDCPSGPRDIIRHDIDGLLVPPQDLDALGAAVERLMSDADERRRLGSRALEVVDRFSLKRIIGMWEDAIRTAVGGESPQKRP